MSNISWNIWLIDRLGRMFPRVFWNRYTTLAQRQGFTRLYLLLSFDCDTDKDARAALLIDDWLEKRKIQRTYAVPGSILETNSTIYKSIGAKGSEFLNHGYLPHTVVENGVYSSTTFYHRMEPHQIAEDVNKGHGAVTKIIGRDPGGFRAPHFGRVPLSMQRNLIRPVLKTLGERFSTQTTPFVSFEKGPIWVDNDWVEFPVIGSSRAPFSVLDSYSYINNPSERKVTPQFAAVFRSTIEDLLTWKICGLLNFYVDPSHVVDDPGFFETLQIVHDRGIPSLTYSQALEMRNQGKF
ncbi:polysaccharide deacetylase family protein [Leptolinea tardivitalis]|uniref:NodB homology domain-containing protein n=1 Tax=Leptolinea tardivitalis TaxID=229920 RepID=A0A0P6WYE9_9CHLR|nr:polysaccharide deacetylase family protein [Leptolinea tardivitalis]KPL71605.1 hypothetical protein ADM99_08960 [Leptolinea tardivitalis]GAP19930.1 predicted xylanase [Leptolinea tardivitalis]